jgi:hypothetical protein
MYMLVSALNKFEGIIILLIHRVITEILKLWGFSIKFVVQALGTIRIRFVRKQEKTSHACVPLSSRSKILVGRLILK